MAASGPGAVVSAGVTGDTIPALLAVACRFVKGTAFSPCGAATATGAAAAGWRGAGRVPPFSIKSFDLSAEGESAGMAELAKSAPFPFLERFGIAPAGSVFEVAAGGYAPIEPSEASAACSGRPGSDGGCVCDAGPGPIPMFRAHSSSLSTCCRHPDTASKTTSKKLKGFILAYRSEEPENGLTPPAASSTGRSPHGQRRTRGVLNMRPFYKYSG